MTLPKPYFDEDGIVIYHGDRAGGTVAKYVNSSSHAAQVRPAVQAGGWIWRGICPWTKGFGRPNGPGRFSNAAEYVVWGTSGPVNEHDAYPQGWSDLPAGDIGGHIDALPPRDREHVAQKSVEVMTWLLGIAPPQARVLDPFMGSATTLLAARSLGMTAIGFECDEATCEMAARRLERMPRGTEQQPSLFGEVGT